MAAVETASAERNGVLADLDAPPEQRGWRWLLVGKALVAIATGVLAAGIWVVVLVEAEIERDRALERTHVDVRNLATAFGAHVERTLLGVDQILVAIRSDVMRRSGGIDLSGAIESAPALRDLGAAVAVADATGRIVADNVGGVRPPVSIADRDYFRAHRAGGDRPMIGEPVISRLTQRCVITVSRPLFTDAGTFDGVVIIAFLPDYLVNLYRQLEIGRSGAVALLGSDGVIWARVGPMPVDCGRQTPVRPGTTSVLRDGQARVVRSQIDGVDRIFAMRRVGQLPLWVTVGLGRDEVLEKTERETTRLTVFGALATGGVVLFGLLLARDAERRRRAETALRRLNADLAAARATAEARTQQLAATMCHLRDGLSIYDSDHRLVLSNEAHRRLMDLPESLIQPGVSAHDVLRFRAARGDFGPCNPDEEERRRFETIVDAARQGLNEIRRMRTGRLIEMQRTVTPDGGFVSLYRDVTEHRRSMNELAEARRIAEDAAARKSEMLAIVGHEIRTPMTGIVGFLQLLEGTTLTIEQRTYLGIAATSSQALLGLLDDLLVHSRSEAGMLATQLDDCEPHAILRDAAALFGPVAARKSVQLDWQVGADVPAMARTDPGRLRQIVNNLTANGVKFTQSGDVLVRAETIPVPEGRIAAIGERWLRITVADRGPGVPDAEKQRIFEPYVQGSAAGTGDQMVGTGLGLAICRRLVALLDGTIGVADRPGGGAVFWVEVPILPATAAPVIEAVPSDPLDEPGRRILVVEDDPVNQYLAKRFVEHLGHRIEIAGSGSDALAKLSEGGFDVVLMDRQLPDADGIDVVRRLRNGPRGRDLAVVVVTASVDDSSKRLAIEAGAEELLVKPYRLVGLRAAIDRAVRKRRAA